MPAKRHPQSVLFDAIWNLLEKAEYENNAKLCYRAMESVMEAFFEERQEAFRDVNIREVEPKGDE